MFAMVLVLYGIVHFFVLDKVNSPETLFLQLLLVAVLLFSIFVADFIIKRNKITAPNSFTILFYALFIAIFPETLTDAKAILCSLFLLLATRRLISLRSSKETKPKVFDATLWVFIASLFYKWAVLYLLMVFVVIYIYEPKSLRNWLVPLVGLFTFFMITYCILVLAKNTDFIWKHYRFELQLNAEYFTTWSNSIKLVTYIGITLVASIFAFLKLGKSGLGQIVTMRIIGLSFIIGLLVKVLSVSPDSHPILLTFFPASIFMTNYVESIKKVNYKEIVLIISVVVSFSVFITNLTLN